MYLSTFLMRESERYITKILERDKFSLGSQKGGGGGRGEPKSVFYFN